MKIFISYSREDERYADAIRQALEEKGHNIWVDKKQLKTGENFIARLNEGIKSSDAFIIIVSKYSLRSRMLKHEHSALALGDISSNQARVIPVLVDKSTVPSYLASRLYVDLTNDMASGIELILEALSEPEETRKSKRADNIAVHDNSDSLKNLTSALKEGRLTIVCGAGISVSAGIPTWNNLLLGLLERMMAQLSLSETISLKGANAEEFYRRYGASSLILGKYLKSNLGNDFNSELRDALYVNAPGTSDIIEAMVELSRPQRDGSPLDSIITFNFDDLVEENLSNNKVKHRAIYSEGMKNKSSELPVYHVHGYLPRKGKIKKDQEIVFSEDAYHGQFIDSFSWSNLIQLNKLSQNTCLFLGLSLTDPNLRRLLDVANRKNPSKSMNHYIIKKVPGPVVEGNKVDDLAFFLEEQDANELGLNMMWVNEFSEIAPLVKNIID